MVADSIRGVDGYRRDNVGDTRDIGDSVLECIRDSCIRVLMVVRAGHGVAGA